MRAIVAGLIAWAASVAWLASCTPAAAAGPPPPDVALSLRDGRFLHLAPLPFGTLAATPVGAAQFDGSGTRAVLLAEFPGAGVHGDWRSANPTFAYLLDAQRRTLTQLSSDGHAGAVAWTGITDVTIREGSREPYDLSVAGAAGGALPPGRLRASDVPANAAFVSSKSTDRLAVYKTSDGSYIVVQIGARRFRIGGVAHNGAYAIIGGYLAWIDGQRHIARQIARFGPDLAEPLSFSGSPYGDALAPILPLGSPVYQTAYRNGVAYFSFSYGVQRIVAASNDLVNFWFPALPHDPLFTVGDGLGAAPDGSLYFIRPEEDVMLFTRGGRYVRAAMSGLDSVRNPSELDRGFPAIDPSVSALDAALLEWRFYPVGDVSGQRWIGSHLGRVLIGDRAGRFMRVNAPAFPFAVLGRTDDGRLWGAAPISAAARGAFHANLLSALWSTRDGALWRRVAVVHGDIGAISTHGGEVWLALTRAWQGMPMIWLARLPGTVGADVDDPDLLPTAGTYSGEQLAFADLPSGFYLIWGATPGRRLGGEGGPLCGFRIDAAQLSARDSAGENVYTSQRLMPSTDPSLPAAGDQITDAAELLGPSLSLASGLSGGRRLTIATNIAADPAASTNATIMSLDQERAYELKYAGQPFPLAIVRADVLGDTAFVTRTLEYGPLHARGTVERWTKTSSGPWQFAGVTSRFAY